METYFRKINESNTNKIDYILDIISEIKESYFERNNDIGWIYTISKLKHSLIKDFVNKALYIFDVKLPPPYQSTAQQYHLGVDDDILIDLIDNILLYYSVSRDDIKTLSFVTEQIYGTRTKSTFEMMSKYFEKMILDIIKIAEDKKIL